MSLVTINGLAHSFQFVPCGSSKIMSVRANLNCGSDAYMWERVDVECQGEDVRVDIRNRWQMSRV